MNRSTPIVMTLVAALAIATGRCSPAPPKTAPPAAKAVWEGRWESRVYSRSRGGISALFPDPIPRGDSFPVEATITYGEGGDRLEKSFTTVLAASYDAGTLRFTGHISETGQSVDYTAVPNGDFTEFSGDYASLNTDDRGVFFIRKKR